MDDHWFFGQTSFLVVGEVLPNDGSWMGRIDGFAAGQEARYSSYLAWAALSRALFFQEAGDGGHGQSE